MKIYDKKKALERLAEDHELLTEIQQTFFSVADGEIDQFRTCILAGDFAAGMITIHSFKSSSASIGGEQLSRYCSDIEQAIRHDRPLLGVDKIVQDLQQLVSELKKAIYGADI